VHPKINPRTADRGSTLAEIAERTGESQRKFLDPYANCLKNEIIACKNRQYKLTNS
jgi:hypothetical protein